MRGLLLAAGFLALLPSPSAVYFYDVFKLAHLVAGELFHAWEAFGPELPGVQPRPLRRPDTRLLDKLSALRERLDAVEGAVLRNSAQAVHLITSQIPAQLRYELRMGELLQLVQEIRRKDLLLKEYTSRGGNNSEALLDFTRSVVSHETGSVLNLWDRLHSSFLVPSAVLPGSLAPSSVLTLIADSFKEHNENLCNVPQSPKQLLFNLYNSLQMTQLKAYTLMQFSWMYRKLNNVSSNYDEEAKIMRDVYFDHLAKQAGALKEALEDASNEMRKCDPREHIPEVTYTQLTKFLQGYLINEVDMNDKGTCREDCGYYKYAKQYGCFKDTYCSKQPRCQGNIINCQFVDSDMWVCPSENHSGQTRRYDWIKYENGRVLGNTQNSCKRAVTKVDSWWRWLFWHCSYCMCLCDEVNHPLSERYFSLLPTLSNTKNNRVLTGIKFVKKGKFIHIQGQEAELLEEGIVNSSTVKWIPLKDVSENDAEGVDFIKVSWNQRAVDLDDLTAPPNYILTGARWKKLGGHLNFEIKACLSDFKTGKLAQAGEKCQWISNDNTDVSETNPRRKIEMQSPDVPTSIRVPSRVDSMNDSFIEFTHTDMTADVSQSAVPFIDLQPVSPDPPVPLVGAGVYHKGLYRSGGFIAPKVFTMDFTNYIKEDFEDSVSR